MQDFYAFVGEFAIITGVILSTGWCMFKSVESLHLLWHKAREFKSDLVVGIEPKRAAALISSMTPEQQRAMYRKLAKFGD